MSHEEHSHLLCGEPEYEYKSLHSLPGSRPSSVARPASVDPPVSPKPPVPPKPRSASPSPHSRSPALLTSKSLFSRSDGNVAINSPLTSLHTKERSNTVHSEVSATSFGGMSILGGESSPRDVQELLDNLENATRLIRKHIQEEEGLGPRPGEHVLVTRPLIPRWITSYLLVITFFWQVINVGFLEAIDAIKTDNSTEHELRLASNIVMTAFQAVHILLVFFVSYKLVKKVLHRTASGSLLAQSYLSTVLLFAGLYTLEFRFSEHGFNFVFNEDDKKGPTLLFLRMLYFSTSTATLCGTSEVEPIDWYASLTVCLQMLMSFVYFASILSLGVVPRRKTSSSRASPSLSRKLRSWLYKNKNRNTG